MKKISGCLAFAFLFLCIPLKAYRYELSVCAFFRDEAPFLKEWIEFHRLLGAEHFWLYNNNSQDHYLEVLKPYLQARIVELIDWPSPPEESWVCYQREAYNHCIAKSSKKTQWLAVIDIDEFIVPSRKAEDLMHILRKLSKDPQIAALKIDWQKFGTSHLWDLEPGKTLIESLLFKAPEQDPGNQWVKSICRPRKVKKCGIHMPIQYKKGCFGVHVNGKRAHPSIQVNPLRIHHYWTRTEKFFYEVKAARRVRSEGKPYTQGEIDNLLQLLNSTQDLTALKYVPALHQRMQSPQFND